MRLCTWNVNGLESLIRKGYFTTFIQQTNPDIICFQETKISRRKLAQWSVVTKDWNCFLSLCKSNEGYSGVGTFCKLFCPLFKAEEGITGFLPAECLSWNSKRPWFCHLRGNPTWRETSYSVGYHFEVGEDSDKLLELDKEGRCIIVEFPDFVLFNIYVPFNSDEETFEYKYLFLQSLSKRIEKLLQGGKNVVVCGDFNCARTRMDHCDPDGIFQKQPRDIPFELEPCRILLNEICTPKGPMVDVFRHFHPERIDAYTCWNAQTGARKTNFGTRIDYILANKEFVDSCIVDCDIVSDIYGSDHCPVYIDFHCSMSVQGSWIECVEQLPPFCCQHFPDLLGLQQSLKDMVSCSVNVKHSRTEEVQRKDLCFKETTRSKRSRVRNRKMDPQSEKDVTLTSLITYTRAYSENSKNAEKNYCPTVRESEKVHLSKYQKAKEDWRKLFQSRQTVPLCSGHQEPCQLRIVKKKGSNLGRKFYVCARPIGKGEEGRCNFFLWYENRDAR